MSKIDTYREHLRQMCDWESFLLAESRLPGPRGNLELARAAADEGDATQFARWLAVGPGEGPTNTPGEFLAFCGALGYGRLLAEGDGAALTQVRQAANDPRWRVREAAAMALQRWGEADMAALLAEAARWAAGTRLEQRAAAAGLCEPALLTNEATAGRVLDVLDAIMVSVRGAADRRSAEFVALRKALGYCWSVAAVAAPDKGQALIEKWLADDDPDVRWIMRQNLGKARLSRLDADWTARQLARVRG
ncbi:MAG: hypothetical protein IPH95_15600 [Candidatus Promineofilum sp.]|nr:hypothetical protein [Promineifilum sp.]